MIVATITPENANNKDITWSSSSDVVATVDNNGRVTGVKAGSATITAATVDEDKTAECSITVERKVAPSVTIGAERISAISAVLKGKANLSSTASSSLRVGFQYSKSSGILPSNSTTIVAEDADADYNYSAILTDLEPETTYYFRSFVSQNGNEDCGETMAFKTKGASSLIETVEADDISATRAILKAKLDLADIEYDSTSFGFYWGLSAGEQTNCIQVKEISDDNSFSATLEDLAHKTQYWYKSYVKLDSQTFFGEVLTFLTDVVPVESVSFDRTNYTFKKIGETITLTATVLPIDADDKRIEWTSSNTQVATVNQEGCVTSTGNGNATITATTEDQRKVASCIITVAQQITGIRIDQLDQSPLSLFELEDIHLTATITPDNAINKTLTWSSSNENIVKIIDQEGRIMAGSKGQATIRATANDGSGVQSSIKIYVLRPVHWITTDVGYSMTLKVGETKQINATVEPADASNTGLSWTSSNPAIVSVSASGLIKGLSPGTSTITISAKDGSGVKDFCNVTVKQQINAIALDKTSLDLIEGDFCQLTSTVSPDDAYDKTILWSSDNPSVATVDDNGFVRTYNRGKATISVVARDGNAKATCNVIVSYPCPDEAIYLGTKTDDGYRLYWAKSNLSVNGLCDNPEDYGDYFAWGEIEPYYVDGHSQDSPCINWKSGKTGYNTESYKWKSGYSGITLSIDDDAAHVILGGEWRMPSRDEFANIVSKCEWTPAKENEVSGYRVTAQNGNSIYFPAAGVRKNNTVEGRSEQVSGAYWSTSSDGLWFLPESDKWGQGPLVAAYISHSRFMGLSIRPVRER